MRRVNHFGNYISIIRTEHYYGVRKQRWPLLEDSWLLKERGSISWIGYLEYIHLSYQRIEGIAWPKDISSWLESKLNTKYLKFKECKCVSE